LLYGGNSESAHGVNDRCGGAAVDTAA
jgi:hypothetical protein